eukprot:gnl/Trimastix_PCT/3939.p2 GENE.gnl/Trimastix_PCT/3939~~gnl/Trimastix_PCT/3939.p2  ORF type:complete len:414 (-),score=55.51 gnl/Trimastix_PCT/3939:205-1446(-)
MKNRHISISTLLFFLSISATCLATWGENYHDAGRSNSVNFWTHAKEFTSHAGGDNVYVHKLGLLFLNDGHMSLMNYEGKIVSPPTNTSSENILYLCIDDEDSVYQRVDIIEPGKLPRFAVRKVAMDTEGHLVTMWTVDLPVASTGTLIYMHNKLIFNLNSEMGDYGAYALHTSDGTQAFWRRDITDTHWFMLAPRHDRIIERQVIAPFVQANITCYNGDLSKVLWKWTVPYVESTHQWGQIGEMVVDDQHGRIIVGTQGELNSRVFTIDLITGKQLQGSRTIAHEFLHYPDHMAVTSQGHLLISTHGRFSGYFKHIHGLVNGSNIDQVLWKSEVYEEVRNSPSPVALPDGSVAVQVGRHEYNELLRLSPEGKVLNQWSWFFETPFLGNLLVGSRDALFSVNLKRETRAFPLKE